SSRRLDPHSLQAHLDRLGRAVERPGDALDPLAGLVPPPRLGLLCRRPGLERFRILAPGAGDDLFAVIRVARCTFRATRERSAGLLRPSLALGEPDPGRG